MDKNSPSYKLFLYSSPSHSAVSNKWITSVRCFLYNVSFYPIFQFEILFFFSFQNLGKIFGGLWGKSTINWEVESQIKI